MVYSLVLIDPYCVMFKSIDNTNIYLTEPVNHTQYYRSFPLMITYI